jgi:5,5'-dehydrodivanillate O-demethylase
MLTIEQNERLTRVGPGTPCGELLRRYWMALCPAGEITEAKPKKRIRVLGEDLLIYRTDSGQLSCIEEYCAHRRASLYFGFIEPDGIRCCYHGWKFDLQGRCIERPFEKAAPGDIAMHAYPVQELGGLLFVYMGPDPQRAPLLPRWDVLVREDGKRSIAVLPVHGCNWLQAQENTVDSVHTYYLHAHMAVVKGLPQGRYHYRPIIGYDWGVCEWGIEKTIVHGGAKPEIQVRPPLIFPNILRIPESQPVGPAMESLHFRVPIDDTHTRVIQVGLLPLKEGESHVASAQTPFEYLPGKPLDYDAPDMDTFYGQDRTIWETQGAIYDRSTETLGATDRGIVMFRRMLAEQIDRVERGEEPTVAVVRDPAKNTMIVFENATPRPPAEDEKHLFTQT